MSDYAQKIKETLEELGSKMEKERGQDFLDEYSCPEALVKVLQEIFSSVEIDILIDRLTYRNKSLDVKEENEAIDNLFDGLRYDMMLSEDDEELLDDEDSPGIQEFPDPFNYEEESRMGKPDYMEGDDE